MKIVSMSDYYKTVQEFVSKHQVNKVETSELVNGQWHKNYLCEDGSAGTEVNRTVYETVEVEVKGLKIKVEVKLLETEWFDTDNSHSVYMYQKY